MKIKKALAALLSVCLIFVFYGGITAAADTQEKPAAPKITSIIYSEKTLKTKITWDKISGADGYELYYSQYPCRDYKPLAAVSGSETGLTTDKLTVKKLGVATYGSYVRIRAYRQSGNSRIYSKWSGIYMAADKCTIQKIKVTDKTLPTAKKIKIRMKGGSPCLHFECAKHDEVIAWQINFYDANDCKVAWSTFFGGGPDSKKYDFWIGDLCSYTTTVKTITITPLAKGESGGYGDGSPAGETAVFKCNIAVNASLQSKKLTAVKKINEETGRINIKLSDKFNSGLPFDLMMYGDYYTGGFSTTAFSDEKGVIEGDTYADIYDVIMVHQKGALRLALYGGAEVTGDDSAVIKINVYDVTVKE